MDLGYFHILTIMNNAAINIHVQIFNRQVFLFFGYLGMDYRSYGNSV